jgi:hypothetical protein
MRGQSILGNVRGDDVINIVTIELTKALAKTQF